MVNTENEARRLTKKAFGIGFEQYNRLGSLKERWQQYRSGNTNLTDVAKGIVRLFYTTPFARIMGREKGYIYFQDFIPNNTRDNRIIVIGNRAFGLSRLMRKGDFRSGDQHGVISKREFVYERCVRIAFYIAFKLKSQSLGFDFIFDQNNNPAIAEMGYGFIPETYKDCPGYWDADLNWHEGKFTPQEWMIEDIIQSNKNKK